MCCLYTSCSNDNRATVCFRFLWTHLLYLFQFFFFFFSFSLSSPFKWDLGTLNIWSTSLSINPSALYGTTAAQVWWAQTAEALGLSTGNELKNLGIREDRWIQFLRSRLEYFLAGIKLPLKGETCFPPCTAMCQLCWYVGMSQMEGSQDWLALWDAEALGMSLQQE